MLFISLSDLQVFARAISRIAGRDEWVEQSDTNQFVPGNRVSESEDRGWAVIFRVEIIAQATAEIDPHGLNKLIRLLHLTQLICHLFDLLAEHPMQSGVRR